jgi:hypothetical protein
MSLDARELAGTTDGLESPAGEARFAGSRMLIFWGLESAVAAERRTQVLGELF